MAVRLTLFSGAVPEEGTAIKSTDKILTSKLSTGEVPPGPVQDKPNMELAVTFEMVWVPEAAFVPAQLAGPVAVQEVASAELQLRITAPPLEMEIGHSEKPAAVDLH